MDLLQDTICEISLDQVYVLEAYNVSTCGPQDYFDSEETSWSFLDSTGNVLPGGALLPADVAFTGSVGQGWSPEDTGWIQIRMIYDPPVTSGYPSCPDTTIDSVYVLPLVASFDVFPTDTCTNDPVTPVFTNLSYGQVDSLVWFQDNGTNPVPDVPSPNFTYGYGVHHPGLRVIDQTYNCASDTTERLAYGTPTAAFSASITDLCAPGFSVLESSAGIPDPDLVERYVWVFENGDSITTVFDTLLYSFNQGVHDVQHLVVGINGCRDSVTYVDYIRVDSNFKANFSFLPTNPCTNDPVQFTNGSTSELGITSLQWSFSAGGGSTLTNPPYVFPSAGNYTVSLTATNTIGCTDTETKSIQVGLNVPTISPFQTTHCYNTPINFNYGLSPAQVFGYDFNWDFGDGNTSTLQQPQHTYATGGT